MPITRHGYAKHRRNGSTRAYRKQRALVIANALNCGICHKPFKAGDDIEADHIDPHADGGSDHASNLRAVHRTCNRKRGRR